MSVKIAFWAYLSLKKPNFLIFLYEHLEFRAQPSSAGKKFDDLEARNETHFYAPLIRLNKTAIATCQRGSVNKAHFVTQPNLLITPHN